MSVSVVIPWRGGCPHREAALAWVVKQFPSDWQIVLGECDARSDWCKGAAVEQALAQAEGDVIVVHDADVWCHQTYETVDNVSAGAPWAHPHRQIRRLTPEATAAVLSGGQVGGAQEEPTQRAHPGGGIVVLHKYVIDAVPFDHKFIGWGHEDDAWGMAIRTMFGPPPKAYGALYHLWHPPQQRRDRYHGSEESLTLFRRYDAAYGKPEQMSALLAEVADDRHIR